MRIDRVPEEACKLPHGAAFITHERPGLGAAAYLYLPEGSRLPVVEVGSDKAWALARLATRPEAAPWQTCLLAHIRNNQLA